MRYTIFVLTVIALLGFSGIASADHVQTTFTYDFGNGDRDGSAASASNVNPYFNVSDYVAASPQENLGADSSPEDSGLISGGAYVRTHIMPGYQTFSLDTLYSPVKILSFDRITFDLTTFGFNSPITTGSTMRVDVLASTDGFATSSINLGNLIITQTNDFTDPIGAADFDLSGFTQFQDLENTNVDFRVSFSSNLNDNGAYGLMDNFALTITAVPEPCSIGILALIGCVGFGARRRR